MWFFSDSVLEKEDKDINSELKTVRTVSFIQVVLYRWFYIELVWCNSLLLNSIVFITVSHSIRHCRILSVVLSLRMYIRTRSLHSLRMYSSSFPILYPLHMLQNILSSFILFIFGMPLTKAAFFLSVSLMVFESSVQQDILPFPVYSCFLNGAWKKHAICYGLLLVSFSGPPGASFFYIAIYRAGARTCIFYTVPLWVYGSIMKIALACSLIFSDSDDCWYYYTSWWWMVVVWYVSPCRYIHLGVSTYLYAPTGIHIVMDRYQTLYGGVTIV